MGSGSWHTQLQTAQQHPSKLEATANNTEQFKLCMAQETKFNVYLNLKVGNNKPGH